MRATDVDPLEALGDAYVAVVSDALDRLGLREQALDPAIRPLYPGARLAGRAMPILVEASDRVPHEPYRTEMDALESLRPDELPVIAADPGTQAALWGELFSCAARGRGAVGAVVDGFVRDARQVTELRYPVFSRGCSPLDTLGRAEARAFRVEVVCGGVSVRPGDYMIADDDGVVAVPADAIDDVLDAISGKIRKEAGAREDLLAGVGIKDVWEKYGVL